MSALLVLDPGNYIGRLPTSGLDLIFYDSIYIDPNVVRYYRINGTFVDVLLDLANKPILTLAVSFTPSSLTIGGTTILRITLTNNTRVPMTNVRCSGVTLPAGLSVASFSTGNLSGIVNSGASGAGSNFLAFSGGAIPAETSRYVEYTLNTSSNGVKTVLFLGASFLSTILVAPNSYDYSVYETVIGTVTIGAVPVPTPTPTPVPVPTPTPTPVPTPTPTPTPVPTPTPTPTPTPITPDVSLIASFNPIGPVASGSIVNFILRVNLNSPGLFPNGAFNFRGVVTLNSYLSFSSFVGVSSVSGITGGPAVDGGSSGSFLAFTSNYSFTSGTGGFTVTWACAATNLTGNSVTGVATIPNSAVTFDWNSTTLGTIGTGTASVIINPAAVVPTPTPTPAPVLIGSEIYIGPLSLATFTVPAGVTSLQVVTIGGGANGLTGTAAAYNGGMGAGGSGGESGQIIANIIAVTPGQQITYIVGGPGQTTNTGGYTSSAAGGITQGGAAQAVDGYGGNGAGLNAGVGGIPSPSGPVGYPGGNGGMGSGGGGGGGDEGNAPGAGGIGGPGMVGFYWGSLSGYISTAKQPGQTGGNAIAPPPAPSPTPDGGGA